ncbi:DNA dC-_dU-editing enzyme APOBEC-3H isoform X4 [Pongo pygmaeus]|uniref:single-stranded DNA cytosine deaminase n=2 Tax=Pongo TaxID=9599 RepID=H2P4F3_PONAB|nr:DNA dC->dU-editing enzyme APOBEC-3H isoform X1 [Pongo abelii]XP_024095719.1 DNA dC->dU-editing enzyme APOBEC-3H isoform X1 [Pongo abelii]XP_054326441.1 DNA dC->dU-editing enzyme APOBEC-3H isoform X4 [Pongo pygmaeus]XP_054399447.1 DNA dC->dU-editing enzyme APOBEC-3H isoform X1 [Pongo abelii]ACJ60859.1 apolipoprotein B mRNA editing enzyme catalytic polypeptide-like protein 3H [Pongo pygmaeus]
MALLTAKTFSLQFNNKRRIKRPYYPRKALLCYQLTPQNGSTPTRGYFKNKKKCHAEIRFINEIKSMGLDETQCYQVTCYLTWSPCPSCVRELVAFIKAHDHLNLRIFASRLYCHWCRRQQEGLRLLCGSQVPVEVMGSREFADCWENFVDHKEPLSFNPSEMLEELDKNSRAIKRRLERIKQSWSVDVLENGLRSLQLGPVSSSLSRSNSR